MSDSQPPAQATAPSPRERRLRLLLIASLAVNLLIVGAVVGAGMFMKRHGPPHGMRRGEDFGLMAFTRTLEPERRKEIRKELRNARKEIRPLMEAIEEARSEAATVLAAEPFDRTALKIAADKVTEREQTLKAAALNVFLDQAEKLTAEERKSLSEWWKKRRQRRGPRPDDEQAAKEP